MNGKPSIHFFEHLFSWLVRGLFSDWILLNILSTDATICTASGYGNTIYYKARRSFSIFSVFFSSLFDFSLTYFCFISFVPFFLSLIWVCFCNTIRRDGCAAQYKLRNIKGDDKNMTKKICAAPCAQQHDRVLHDGVDQVWDFASTTIFYISNFHVNDLSQQWR